MEEKKETAVVKKRKPAAGKTSAHKSAPQKLKLLFTVVNENKSEFYMDFLQSFCVNMQFCTAAQGTAGSDILRLLGLESMGKRVICSLIRENMAVKAMQALEEKFNTIKNGKGIALTVPLSGVIGVSVYQFLCDNRKNVKEAEL